MNIHLDLDETLTHTCSLGIKPSSHEKYFMMYMAGHEYNVILRPIAHDLIAFCQNLAGLENLHLTTYSDADYADKIVQKFGFPFMARNIHPRSSIDCGIPLQCECENVLVDNLFWFDHRNTKIPYLNLKRENYIQIPDFFGNADLTTEEEILYRICAEIEEKM